MAGMTISRYRIDSITAHMFDIVQRHEPIYTMRAVRRRNPESKERLHGPYHDP